LNLGDVRDGATPVSKRSGETGGWEVAWLEKDKGQSAKDKGKSSKDKVQSLEGKRDLMMN